MITDLDIGRLLASASSENELRRAGDAAADFLGAMLFAFAYMPSAEHGEHMTIRVSTNERDDCLLKKETDDPQETAVGKRDWVSQYIRCQSTPVYWDRASYVDADQLDCWDYQVRVTGGGTHGIAVALHLDQGRHFVAGFDWSEDRPLAQMYRAQAMIATQTFALFAEPALHRVCSLRQRLAQPAPPILTPRETECLYWAGCGMTDLKTAVLLNISPRTVRKHIESAMEKLNAPSRTAAAVLAERLGLTPKRQNDQARSQSSSTR